MSSFDKESPIKFLKTVKNIYQNSMARINKDKKFYYNNKIDNDRYSMDRFHASRKDAKYQKVKKRRKNK